MVPEYFERRIELAVSRGGEESWGGEGYGRDREKGRDAEDIGKRDGGEVVGRDEWRRGEGMWTDERSKGLEGRGKGTDQEGDGWRRGEGD